MFEFFLVLGFFVCLFNFSGVFLCLFILSVCVCLSNFTILNFLEYVRVFGFFCQKKTVSDIF